MISPQRSKFYRGLRRSWGFTEQDLLVVAGIIVVFALAYVWWIHSPTYLTEIASQRQSATEFLQIHKQDILQDQLDSIMSKYNISQDELGTTNEP